MPTPDHPSVQLAPPDHARITDWSQLRRILVATDGSSSSSDAVALAVGIAAHHHAELIVAHVVATLDFVFPMDAEDIGVALPHEPTTLDHEALVVASSVGADHGVDVTTVLLAGAAADEIIKHGDSADVDLTIVGSHDHGVIASAVVGSVSLRVLRTSTRPVLIVRGPHASTQPVRTAGTTTPHHEAGEPRTGAEAPPP